MDGEVSGGVVFGGIAFLENTGDKTIIYVPSDGTGIPVMEAGRGTHSRPVGAAP